MPCISTENAPATLERSGADQRELTPMATKTLSERFWEKVERAGPGECWNWTGWNGHKGYGRIWVDGAGRPAHRVSYELAKGPIPEGLVIDHLCRNPGCVNPDHLEPVTQAENNRRGIGITSVNLRKTHCIHGHAFDAENTMVDADGHRRCRACHRAYREARASDNAALRAQLALADELAAVCNPVTPQAQKARDAYLASRREETP